MWSVVESCELTNDKDQPRVKCFTSILDSGMMLNGYYRDGVVSINADLAPVGATDVGQLSNRLLKVAMEEVAHFVTGATDNSRDFQDYLLEPPTTRSTVRRVLFLYRRQLEMSGYRS